VAFVRATRAERSSGVFGVRALCGERPVAVRAQEGDRLAGYGAMDAGHDRADLQSLLLLMIIIILVAELGRSRRGPGDRTADWCAHCRRVPLVTTTTIVNRDNHKKVKQRPQVILYNTWLGGLCTSVQDFS